MEPVSRRAFGLGVASLAACGRLEEPGAPRDDAGTSPAAFNPDARPLCAFPAWPALGVDPNAPARRTLYSWTSTAQAEQLAADKQLYTRTADDLGRAGYLFELLAQRARGGDEVARALSHEEFRLGRFCWTSPWASQLAGEDYGTELIRIDLSRNSLFVLVDSERETYSAVDIDNRPVAVAEALRQKERVAGIFFTNVWPRSTAATTHLLEARCIESFTCATSQPLTRGPLPPRNSTLSSPRTSNCCDR